MEGVEAMKGVKELPKDILLGNSTLEPKGGFVKIKNSTKKSTKYMAFKITKIQNRRHSK